MKAVIYCRVSTEEQYPEQQIKECQEFALSKGYEVIKILTERISGYKQVVRPKYDLVKQMAFKGEVKAVIVWSLDRWVRNRDTLLTDVTLLTNYGCKLHSIKENFIEAINIEGAMGRTIQDFLLGLMGSMGEIESSIKSERVKKAIKKDSKGITRSYNGKKWGRRGLPKQTKDKVLGLYDMGYTIRAIAETVKTYDKYGNGKTISASVVHKIITVHKTTQQKDS